MKSGGTRYSNALISKSNLIRLVILAAVAALVAVPLYTVSSASSEKNDQTQTTKSVPVPLTPAINSVAGQPLFFTGPIDLFKADCTTPQTTFAVGDTICAHVTGSISKRLTFVDPIGFIRQITPITSDPQDVLFQIPATNTTPINGGSVDNRGTWRVNVISFRALVVGGAKFTVNNANNPAADLFISKAARGENETVAAGSTSSFEVFVRNDGPDTANNVVLSEVVPNDSTFTAFTQSDGPVFTCTPPAGGTGPFTCTIASLAAGATAQFDFAFTVNTGVAGGTVITNTATISSDTEDPGAGDNSASAQIIVAANGTGGCSFDCPDNITVTANTTQGGEPGAFVSYPSANNISGSCGAISANPASGSFFPVGTTTVNTSSEAGTTCSFTVTVTTTPAPTITCPPDKTATADSGGTATVSVGTPTTTPSTGVTVTGVRSDDETLALTAPYPTGVTGITWTVTDASGRTASCTQRITVHAACASDTEAPTITAPPDISVGTGPGSTTCGAVLDDELGQPTAHDDCSFVISVTGVPPGNLFPIGTTTVTYTATDGAGHTASATQHVTVTDNTPPVIFAPANAAYTCPEQVPALSPSQAFGPNIIVNGQEVPGPVFDNCGNPTVTASETTSGVGSAIDPRIITRTYTALDTHGNSASAVQLITVTDSTPPSITAPANVIAYTGPNATTCDTVVSNAVLGTASAQDNCAGVMVSRSPSGNTFPVGTTTVTWTATDWAGNTSTATQTVTVIDNTPPTITLNGQTPSLWPPNHRYQTFTVGNFVSSVFDNCGGVTVGDVKIDQVTSDETENGNGDGNTTNDILIASDCKSVQLRAERDGGGDGRVYTITFRLTDTHGNTTTATATVVVRHNPGETPVDSGPHYTVLGGCQ